MAARAVRRPKALQFQELGSPTQSEPVPSWAYCARCGQLFFRGFSGAAVMGDRHTHYPNCPKGQPYPSPSKPLERLSQP